MVNEILVKASTDTAAIYGVKKCAEIIFKRRKMVKGDGLQVINDKMKALDPEQNEIYKLLGCEQSEEIEKDRIMERIANQMEKRKKQLINQQLYDRTLIKAINCRVIPVASYFMNVCKFTITDLNKLDKVIKKALRENNMHGRQSSDERRNLKRKKGGRGLKTMEMCMRKQKL